MDPIRKLVLCLYSLWTFSEHYLNCIASSQSLSHSEQCIYFRVFFQTRGKELCDSATSPKTCPASMSAVLATQPGRKAATSIWRSPPVSIAYYDQYHISITHPSVLDLNDFKLLFHIHLGTANNAWVIAGAAVGSAVGLMALVLFLIFILKRNSDTEEEMSNDIK